MSLSNQAALPPNVLTTFGLHLSCGVRRASRFNRVCCFYSIFTEVWFIRASGNPVDFDPRFEPIVNLQHSVAMRLSLWFNVVLALHLRLALGQPSSNASSNGLPTCAVGVGSSLWWYVRTYTHERFIIGSKPAWGLRLAVVTNSLCSASARTRIISLDSPAVLHRRVVLQSWTVSHHPSPFGENLVTYRNPR